MKIILHWQNASFKRLCRSFAEISMREEAGLTISALLFSRHMTPDQMKERLEKYYPGGKVEVFDLTGTQDHYEVVVESGLFSGMTRIQQHQHVMACFGPELKTGEVHALSIKTKII